MCFYVPKNQRVKTAEEDITCYKIVTKEFSSLFQNFMYKWNKQYSIKNFPEYHNITNNIFALSFRFDLHFHNRIINEGFHSYIDEDYTSTLTTLLRDDNKIVECIIPKGSKYHFNLDEYVSNSIIIKRRINN